MRVSTIMIILIVVILAVTGVAYFFGGLDGLQRYATGFKPAATPGDAMEKFREAIQKRRYSWAAAYCTKDYADILVKSDSAASRLGKIIDDVNTYMENKNLQTDKAVIALWYLDPFPTNFKISGAPKEKTGTEAAGVFQWEALKLTGAVTPTLSSFNIDTKMYTQMLVPPNFTSAKIVKEGEQWKLDFAATPMLDNVRYFLDNWQKYESELGTFRRDMTNGRYDSPKAFESEVLDVLKKAGGR